MTVKYFADDGTEFESEEDCQLYETHREHAKMPLMWTEDETPVELNKMLKGNASIGDVTFVMFRDFTEYDNYCFWSDYYGYDTPDFYGEGAQYPKRFYYDNYDGYNGDWRDLDAEIKRLYEIRTLFEKRA